MKIRLLVIKENKLLARVIVGTDNNVDAEEVIVDAMSITIKEIYKDTNEIPDGIFRVDFIGYYLSFISYKLGLLFKM